MTSYRLADASKTTFVADAGGPFPTVDQRHGMRAAHMKACSQSPERSEGRQTCSAMAHSVGVTLLTAGPTCRITARHHIASCRPSVILATCPQIGACMVQRALSSHMSELILSLRRNVRLSSYIPLSNASRRVHGPEWTDDCRGGPHIS